jgi:flagellar FliJ protein
MKKFQFRLEALLHHRCNIEEKERTRFLRIRSEILTETDHRETLRAKQSETLIELSQRTTGIFDSQEILWFHHYLARLARQIERSEERIAALEKELEAQKQVMIAAMRDRKIIENLRGKKEKEFQVSLEREEQKFIDEMVVIRYGFGR